MLALLLQRHQVHHVDDMDLQRRKVLSQDLDRSECFPKRRIKLLPYFVASMIPRPAHIQGRLSQGIESLQVRGQKTVDRLADTGLLAHGLSFKFVLTGIPGSCGDAARASLTIVCASSSMRRR
jgi:hypothetical protein